MITNLQEEAAKVKLIESIAKSQMAMARILESLADISGHSGTTARHLAENINILSKYQDAMARTVCGIHVHRVQFGTPSSPWIMESCYPATAAARGVQEDNKNNANNQNPAKTPA
ncbi:hypothetical protein DFP94_104225 [Fontibacillus phaseoli]|uniref:Uncharacterized protein n=1 Tax=Fontibacillus phaseoli TaxID=1416533 RepID=A0A369BDX9_9BACL|nr:hypothetical protein [Fontibacillus phaseoli]RCX19770.1 hypothetical protein DFP94_104225 [Fontibacillus phaseoli]